MNKYEEFCTQILTPTPWQSFLSQRTKALALTELLKRELRRRNLLPFIECFVPHYEAGWFHRELCDTLDAFVEAVEQKRSPRLIIEVPPRAGKSEIVSRHFGAHCLGKHPEWEVVNATYGQELANDFGRYLRSVLNNPTYSELFPQTDLDPANNSVSEIGTTQRGRYMAVGIGGALTGKGAHVLLIDDPHKDRLEADSERERDNVWNWYSAVARTRLYPGGGVIVLQTRWHENDLAGRLQLHAKENPDADQWMVVSYPAIATCDDAHRKTGDALHPERYDIDELLRIKATIEPRDWAALYQQNPTPDDGLFFSKEMIQKCMVPANEYPEKRDLNFYICCDLAIGEKQTSDYTVITTFGVDYEGTMWFMPNVQRFRGDANEIVDRILSTAIQYDVLQIIIERGHISKAIGPLLSKTMRDRRRAFSIWDPVPHRDKQYRAAPLQGRMQQGMVRFPNTSLYDTEIIPELLGFPAAMHDDVVDSMAWGAQYLDKQIASLPPPPRAKSKAPAWSMEWMEKRISPEVRRSSMRRRITHLNGKPL